MATYLEQVVMCIRSGQLKAGSPCKCVRSNHYCMFSKCVMPIRGFGDENDFYHDLKSRGITHYHVVGNQIESY